MVRYRVTTNKTQRGYYKVSVSVDDGLVLKPLVKGLHRFFEKWEEQYGSKEGDVNGFVEDARSESERLRSIQRRKKK